MTAGFLERPPITPKAQALFDDDVKETGYLWNVSRLWAYQPDTVERLFELMSQAFRVTPDAQLVAALPPAVTAAVTYGRPPDAPAL